MARVSDLAARSASRRRVKYAAPAVDKALEILECLAREAVPLNQAQLARALGRKPGELFRILTCLEARGYLCREPAGGAYSLSLKLFELSRTHSPYERLLQVAAPRMRALSDAVRESCHLSVLHHGQVLVLAQELSPRPVRLSVEVGSLHPLLGTASGRMLLASMAPAELEETLAGQPDWKRRRERERGALQEQLAQVRARGYSRADGEWFPGCLDLAVLVGAPGAQVRAALIIAALRQHDRDLAVAEMLPQLTRCAREIAAVAGLGGEEGRG